MEAEPRGTGQGTAGLIEADDAHRAEGGYDYWDESYVAGAFNTLGENGDWALVLGFDGGLGTPLEAVDGVYTGRLAGPFAYRDGKPQLMRELAAERHIDLSESYAYSDSESDLPMLRAVGHPVAVNPDGALARVAREEGWDVLRFDRLGGRLKMLGGLGAAPLVGAAGATARKRVVSK